MGTDFRSTKKNFHETSGVKYGFKLFSANIYFLGAKKVAITSNIPIFEVFRIFKLILKYRAHVLDL